MKKPSTLDLRAAASPSVTPRKKQPTPPPDDEDIDPDTLEEEGDIDGAPEDTGDELADDEDTGEIDEDDEEDTGEYDEDTGDSPPQAADSPGNHASTRTTADDAPDLRAAPDVSGVASEGTVVFGGEWGIANDTMRQWRDTLGKSTGKLYFTHLHRFFSWCAGQGWVPSSLPEDALIQYAATVIPTYGQFVVSGLKSFVKGGYASHLQLSALEYPRIKRPPARKKQKEEDTMSEELPEVQPRGNVGEFTERMSGERGPRAPSVGVHEHRAPQQQRFTGGDPMMRPRPTARRESTAPITDLLPPRGRFRLFKRPDHGPHAGRRIAVGANGKDIFFQSDLTGFPDFVAFINSKIVPQYGPLPGEHPLSYEVEILDESGRPVPPPTEILIEPPMHAGVNGSFRRNSDDEDKKPSAMELEWIADRKRDREQLAKMLEKQGQSGDSIALILREFDRTTNETNAKMDRKFDELRGEMRRSSAASALALPSGPDPSTTMLATFAGLTEKMMDRTDRAAPPPPAAPDPFALVSSVMGMVKGLMSDMRPPAPAVDPMVAATLAQLAEGQRQMTALIASIANKPTETLEDMLERTAKTMNFARELAGGGEEHSAPGGGAEAVAHAIKDVLSSPVLIEATRRIGGGAAPQRKALKGGGGAGNGNGARPRQPEALPEAAANALHGIREAESDDDIQEALLEFLNALQTSGSDFWLRVLHRIGDAFKALESEEELQPFVINFFKEIGQGQLVKDVPGLATRVAAALALKYSELHVLLTGGEEKTLIRPVTPRAKPVEAKAPVEPPRQPVVRPEPPTILQDSPEQRAAAGVAEVTPPVVAAAETPVVVDVPEVDEPPEEDGEDGEDGEDEPEEEDGD